MPFPKGKSPSPGNPNTVGKRAVTKVQNALDKALDVLDANQVDVQGKTASELSVLLLEALRKDFVGAIKGLSPILPKDVSIDVTRRTEATDMSDQQLLDIIGDRARMRREKEKDVTQETEEVASTGSD